MADYLQSRGKYMVLDLHEYRAAKPHHVAFWLDAATRYKDHPGVIFGLLNEPHDITWEIWRNGGVTSDKAVGAAPAENNEKLVGERTIGMQALVDAVRSTGARNLVSVGGLDWAYTLDGVLDGYALDDGNLMYESHCYPWKKHWKKSLSESLPDHRLGLRADTILGRTRQTRLGRGALRAWADALAARQDFWNRSHLRRARKHRAIAAARTAIQMPKTGRQPLKRSWRAAKP